MLAGYAPVRGVLIKDQPPPMQDKECERLVSQARVLQDEGKAAEAKAALFEAKSSARRMWDRAVLEILLGDIAESNGDSEAAASHFRAACVFAEIVAAGGVNGDEADEHDAACSGELMKVVFGRTAATHYTSGDFDMALTFFGKAKSIMLNTADTSSSSKSKTASRPCNVEEQEQRDKATRTRRACEASIENNVAVCLAALQPMFRNSDVVGMLSSALAVLTETLGPEHPRTATVQYNLTREQERSLADHAVRVRPLSRGLAVQQRGASGGLPRTVVSSSEKKRR